LLRINQDFLGIPAVRLWKRTVSEGGNLQLWTGRLSNGERVVALLNTSPVAINTSVLISDVREHDEDTAGYQVYDLWAKDNHQRWGLNLGVRKTEIVSFVRSHQTKVWRLCPRHKTQELRIQP